MQLYRYAIGYNIYGPKITAKGEWVEHHGLTAEEVGTKLTEILKSIEEFWKVDQEMDHNERFEYNKTHNRIDLSSIDVRYWNTIYA